MTATGRTPSPVGASHDAERPDWFHGFLTDRATRKPSLHTLQAYRQDIDAIAGLVAGGRENIASLTPRYITKDSMRQAFATYATSHEAASIRRCWSTWNTLCGYSFTAELVTANPCSSSAGPNPPKPCPNHFPSLESRWSFLVCLE
jgi:integrase/recombinase XerC